MKLPETVRIGPYDYVVQLEEKVLGDRNQELYGHILYGPQKVVIQSGLTDARTLAILVHEVLHGISEYLEIGLSEKQVIRLTAGLTVFIRDNGLLPKEDSDATPPDRTSADAGAKGQGDG